MTGNHISLTTFYKGWEVDQQHLLTVIAPLSAEQLSLRAAPQLWSVGMIATHIVGTRAGWFHNWMREGGAEMARLVDWGEYAAPTRPAVELISGLTASWQSIQDALRRWTPADLDKTFRSPSTGDNPHPRQWIVWHVLEHDLHHGGEISLTLGMHGLTGIDL